MTVGEGVGRYSNYMFSNCSSLAQVNFPEGLESIGYCAFSSCTALTKVGFPETLVDVEGYAFYNCSIEKLEMPKSMRHIGTDAFAHNPIKTLTLNEGLRSISGYAFTETLIEELVIPDSITDLGMEAFYECTSLRSVKIGKYTNYVTYAAFAVCTSLERVIVPQQCYIVDCAFAGCENLKEIFYEAEELGPYYRIGMESNENEKNVYGNKYYCEAKLYLYSEEPNFDGGHWHYNANGEPEIWAE